jgi:leucyl aminopeptidase (aminopeptidase T)
MDRLYRAAGRAVQQALKVRQGESVLLVTDEAKLEIAKALAFWTRRAGAETTTYLMSEELRPVTGPTRLLRSLAEKASCIVYTLESRLEEKPFRGYLVKTGMSSGRILMMPGINRDMMERLIDIDYAKLRQFTKKVIMAFRGADCVEVENSLGTALRFSVKGRRWVASCGDISRRGTHGNLPAGEGYTAPVEESFEGKLVLSLIDDRLGRGVLEFERGRRTRWEGKGVAAVLRNIGDDETGKVIGEFGIGTNRRARLSANMLEAEKAFGTAHFAIGDSYGLGRNKSLHHYDALVDKVTIRADGRTIIRNGRFCI